MNKDIDTLQKKIERRAYARLNDDIQQATAQLETLGRWVDWISINAKNVGAVEVTFTNAVVELKDAIRRDQLPRYIEEESQKVINLVDEVAELASKQHEEA